MKLIIAFLGVCIAFAAPPQPLHLTFNGTLGSFLTIQNPVEQQTLGGAGQPDMSLWVINNTSSPWDIDDEHWATDTGYLDPGQSASFTETMIADWANSHILGIEAESDSTRANHFLVSIRSDDGAGTSVLVTSRAPVLKQDGNKSYPDTAVALYSQYYQQNSPKLVPIPNSGIGGVGRVLTITYTVTNTGTTRETLTVIRRGIHQGQYSGNVAYWCPEGFPFSIGQYFSGDPSFGWCQAASVQY